MREARRLSTSSSLITALDRPPLPRRNPSSHRRSTRWEMEDDMNSPLLERLESMSVSIPQASSKDSKKVRKVMVKIGGMECTSCAVSIESVAGKIEGIESISVSPLQVQAVIVYILEIVNEKSIQEVIEDVGFHVDEFPQDTSVCLVRIKGMACTSCSKVVERALLLVDGVKKAVVGLALKEAKIHFDPNVTDSRHMTEAIKDAGFGADLISSGDDTNKVHLQVKGLGSLEDVTLIQSSLEATKGVIHVEVDAVGQKITISYDLDLTGPRFLIQYIEEPGQKPSSYQPSLYTPPRRREIERHHDIKVYRDQFV